MYSIALAFTLLTLCVVVQWVKVLYFYLNKEDYEVKYGLPFGLSFNYYQSAYGEDCAGIVIQDKEDTMVLCESRKFWDHMHITQMKRYKIMSDKIIFSFVDSLQRESFCSINKFHNVRVEQIPLQESKVNWNEIQKVRVWLLVKKSWIWLNFNFFSVFTYLVIILDIILLAKSVRLLKGGPSLFTSRGKHKC